MLASISLHKVKLMVLEKPRNVLARLLIVAIFVRKLQKCFARSAALRYNGLALVNIQPVLMLREVVVTAALGLTEGCFHKETENSLSSDSG